MEKDIKEFKQRIDVACTAINNIGRLHNGRNEDELGLPKLVCLDLLQRICSNLWMCGQILHSLTNNYNQKIPLAILIRSCLSDSIIGLYLLILDEVHFNEELDILNLDFANYLKKMLPLEVELYNKLKSENHSCQLEFDVRYDIFKKYLKSVKGMEWETKQRCEFRARKNKDRLTPEYMCKHIAMVNEDLPMLSYMFNFYRYFSQYEHYTFTGRYIVKQEFENDLLHIKSAILMIIQSTLYISTVLEIPDELRSQLRSSIESILPADQS